MNQLTVNSIAPDFSAPDQAGTMHSLAQYAGKYVLLYFYPRDDSPGCTVEACNFRDSFNELKETITLLGVSPDTVESHRRFASKYALPFTILADPEKKIIQLYSANGVLLPKRVSFLIGPDGRIMKIYEKVNVKKHAEQILKDVKDLRLVG